MNKIIIHGFLGRDPELKTYKNAKGQEGSLASFTVGVSRTLGTETDWFDCTAFGKTAEVADKFLSRGSEIVVEGSMESRKYEARDGSKRTAWSIRADRFDFCGKKSGGKEPAPDHDSFEAAEEEIPF